MTSPESLESRLHSVIQSDPTQTTDFNSLALEVFAHQFLHNTPYKNYCTTLGKTPNTITHWHEIPTVPTDAFKIKNFPLRSFPHDLTKHTFTTSGTTSDIKGEHHFPSLALYEQSIISAWKQKKLPAPDRAIFLTPTPEEAPHSSLSHMMGVLSRSWGVHSTWAGELDLPSIKNAASSNTPIAILGTALAFLHLFEQLEKPLILPNGSWAMETGGYKGTSRSLEKHELYSLFSTHLGIPTSSIINEYSMTELSSQFYTTSIGNPHTGPSWTRIRVIDPLTETDALPGKPGHLVIYDLANLHSVMAIRTQDLAIAKNENSFALLGRDPSAIPRGCSRAADHALSP